MARYPATVRDQNGAPIPGVDVYVTLRSGETPVLTDDDDNVLSQPLTTDEYGGFYFNGEIEFYDLAYYYGGRLIQRDYSVPVGGPVPSFDVTLEMIVLRDETVVAAGVATTQAGIATTKANDALISEQNAANSADDAAEYAQDTADALAVAQALMINGNAFSEATLAAAVADGIAAVADGEVFAASGEDVNYWALYRRVGAGSVQLWAMPKALLSASAIPSFTSDRALSMADMVVGPGGGPLWIGVQIDAPAGMYGTATLPSNSVDPLPVGSLFPLRLDGGNPLRFVGDGVDSQTITYSASGFTVLAPIDGMSGQLAWVQKVGTNSWRIFGQLSQPPAGAYSVKIFHDAALSSTVRQERTGASATTPSGDGDGGSNAPVRID